jgi:hypothetical protein
MMKMLSMKYWDLISTAMMKRYKCSQQLAIPIGKGLAQK